MPCYIKLSWYGYRPEKPADNGVLRHAYLSGGPESACGLENALEDEDKPETEVKLDFTSFDGFRISPQGSRNYADSGDSSRGSLKLSCSDDGSSGNAAKIDWSSGTKRGSITTLKGIPCYIKGTAVDNLAATVNPDFAISKTAYDNGAYTLL